MIAQLLLIAALAGVSALGGTTLGVAGWIAGLSCAAISNLALARGLATYRTDRLSTADWVTLARATLAVGVASLVAASFEEPVPVAILVSLAVIALALDAVDGWVARRAQTTRLGARFDGEVDAFLILVLSVHVAPSAGAWVLAIGAARYAFLAAGRALPWMRRPLPPRYWRKVVTATQGIALTIAAAGIVPPSVSGGVLAAALLLLAESFARDVLWLWRHRDAAPGPAVDPNPTLDLTAARHGPGPARTWAAAALTTLALLVVWAALVVPGEPIRLEPSALLRIPLEGLVLIAAAVALPATARRILVWVAGPALGIVVLLKILDLGFFATFNRPFDPYQDVSYAGIGLETLRTLIGPSTANLVIAGAVAVTVAAFAILILAVRRLTRVAAAHRGRSLGVAAAVGVAWVICWGLGAHLVPRTPVASTSSAGLLVSKIGALRAGLADHDVFAREIRHDRFRAAPGSRLLTDLRDKDVILAFVESYGDVAVQGSPIAPVINRVLEDGTRRLRQTGFSSRSAFLTSPTFGGMSWLAHSTLHSGLRVDSPRRYDQLVASGRFTLSRAFERAGWRAVDVVPANDRAWTVGSSFYGFDRVYDRRDLGYEGPSFGYAPMPDQYALAALQENELAKHGRRPVFAELDLVSSHMPWTSIPRLIDWRRVGDGSVFDRIPVDETSKDALWGDSERVRAAYAESIEYTLKTLVSFVGRYGDRRLVLVVLGDHQPWPAVSGQGASHNVPISIVAHDPAVLRQVDGWGWHDGLRPDPAAPVWPMSAFRDRFLSAFGSHPRAGGPG
jgi:phosphatidylglycerophosphate synthase